MKNDIAPEQLINVNAEHAEIERVFERQLASALRLRSSTAHDRLVKIEQLKRAVLRRREEIQHAGALDFGKPAAEVDLTEILPVVAEANDARRHLRKWMRPHRVLPTLLMFGTSSHVRYEPKGRCLIISPWNYPVNLTLGPLVSAIAAGNTAIIKPSEMTPHLSAVIVEIVREVFSEDEVAIFEGDASVSQVLLDLPFDHIFFTGSPAIGKVVMAAAARHLTSVTLELGGKSPTVIDETANLDAAASNLMWSKFVNNGQTCIAPDHVYVHDSVKDKFVQSCKKALEKAFGDATGPNSAHRACIVNQRHTERIVRLLDDAKARGARTLVGGAYNLAERYIAPTLLDNLPSDAAIMEEEIFGPVLPIFGYRDLDAVIAAINAGPKPLALYLWSHDNASINKVLRETSSGGVCINHSVVQALHGRLPFGGVNNSGIGNSHGAYGFKAFSHERAVVRARLMLASVFYPPYSKLSRRLISMAFHIV
ncbi:aldehyde dehydrogenase family protein [Aquabacterium sp. CECT 9606]|uniref:aldehyde dehydrogenase family protein n=1 Tax=Aquabacterium sp. CECT 9606 TaxID=2845822 RepID=UPI001E417B70|nr:aldehyde dehydrogenase family protein [Aquabacterium sp. CECT 9606]CAH0353257.1 Aldehyde dehydrogenase [Aquabacterium sp. CECT 9606]